LAWLLFFECRLAQRRQCALLVWRVRASIGRRRRREDDAAAMRRIDALYTDHPFYGSRRIAFELKMSRKRVQRLMGIAALGPKPCTSKPAPGHKIFPYLLRGVSIERPNQGWACDITYVPIGAGFSMDISFCLEALEEALARFSKASTSTSSAGDLQHRPGQPVHEPGLHRALERAGVRISMDGRGRFLDNIFIERLWRSLKHEDIYLKHYADGREARAGIASWIARIRGSAIRPQ
jgi:putative transposase